MRDPRSRTLALGGAAARPRRRPAGHPLLVASLVLSGGVACGRERPAVRPPDAEFLIAAGDSTFWVQAGAHGVRMRRAPLILAQLGDRYYELYVADDDRSFYDATFVGQRIYRRDLVSNDSIVVFDDPVVPRMALAYARSHPDDQPLGADAEGSESPHTVVTTEAEIIEVVGPYATVEHHTDIDIDRGEDRHVTRRGVVDLRAGAMASLAAIIGDSAAHDVGVAGRRAHAAALDSVRRSGAVGDTSDPRRRAAEAISAFPFDEQSFSLTVHDGLPAIAFLVPGVGERAGGLSLPLPPEPAPPGSWWPSARRSLPTRTDASSVEWRGERYDVIARDERSGERAMLLLRDRARREWPLGPIPYPAQRLWRLDSPPTDAAARRALARAFDESVLYGDDARTASAHPAAAWPSREVRLASRAVRPPTRQGGPPTEKSMRDRPVLRHRVAAGRIAPTQRARAARRSTGPRSSHPDTRS